MDLKSFLVLQTERIRQVGRTTPHFAGSNYTILRRTSETQEWFEGLVDRAQS